MSGVCHSSLVAHHSWLGTHNSLLIPKRVAYPNGMNGVSALAPSPPSPPPLARDFYTRKLAEGGAVLAPMAGFSDAPFRRLCRRFGSAWAVTEMVSAKALTVGDERGLEISAPYEGERDLVIQVFGGEPEVVAAGGGSSTNAFPPPPSTSTWAAPSKR